MSSTEAVKKLRANRERLGMKRAEYYCYPHEKVEHDKLQAKLIKRRDKVKS